MRARRIGQGLCLLYVVVLLAAPWFAPESIAHLVLTDFPPIALVAPALLFLFGPGWRLVRHRSKKEGWKVDAGFTGILILSTLIVLGLEIPSPAPATDGPAFRLMTLNVLKDNRSMPRLADQIRREKIDVIYMQEVKGGTESPASYLQREFPEWHLATSKEAAILSRWPLTDVEVVRLRSLPRTAILATVQAPRPFRAMTIHWTVTQWTRGMKKLEQTSRYQSLDLELTREVLARQTLPVVLGGDLNATPRHNHIAQLRDGMENAFESRGMGFGWSFPWYFPMVRIDHLFSSKPLVPLSARVVSGSGSDHCGLVADFGWQR